MIKRVTLLLTLITASLPTLASPDLIPQSEAQYVQLALIETIQITGDINDSLTSLVDRYLAHKTTDYYSIKDISEDTQANTLTIIVNLYKHENTIQPNQRVV
ncbi:hypothetical protein L4D13_12805 [Photobacterium profundum]|uniref:hypothetical protein n=1 Tax=Photobacterium profundum TaxID=74109 RepID=UPI003D0AF9F7